MEAAGRPAGGATVAPLSVPSSRFACTRTRFKLANEMQQHVAPSPPLSYKAHSETMVTLYLQFIDSCR